MEHDYTGTFEAHITINVDNIVTQEKFRQFCQTLGVKCVLIELSQGVRQQPMTASYHHGTLKNVLVEVYQLAQLIEEGFAVTRIKIEAMVSNQDVPVDDDEAQKLPNTNYFEFHSKVTLAASKVTLPTSADMLALKEYCREHNAHLSANAFKQQIDVQQRFITMRH